LHRQKLKQSFIESVLSRDFFVFWCSMQEYFCGAILLLEYKNVICLYSNYVFTFIHYLIILVSFLFYLVHYFFLSQSFKLVFGKHPVLRRSVSADRRLYCRT